MMRLVQHLSVLISMAPNLLASESFETVKSRMFLWGYAQPLILICKVGQNAVLYTLR